MFPLRREDVMISSNNTERSRIPEAALQEFSRTITGKRFPFVDAIDALDDKESWFVCENGTIVRILRADKREWVEKAYLGTYPAHFQFYDYDGKLVAECTKVLDK